MLNESKKNPFARNNNLIELSKSHDHHMTVWKLNRTKTHHLYPSSKKSVELKLTISIHLQYLSQVEFFKGRILLTISVGIFNSEDTFIFKIVYLMWVRYSICKILSSTFSWMIYYVIANLTAVSHTKGQCYFLTTMQFWTCTALAQILGQVWDNWNPGL